METLTARLHTDFSDTMGNVGKVLYGVDARGRPMAFAEGRLAHAHPDGIFTLDLRGSLPEAHYIAAASDGLGYWLVGARCTWTREAVERNAVLYASEDGEEVRRITVGDGIADLRGAPDGLWVSFFDEGIFGNCGWGHPGPAPIGDSGIVRIDERYGDVGWGFEPPAGFETMADVYAFNVSGRPGHPTEIWTCYYTDFPIVRIRGEETEAWVNNEVAGARAIAAQGDRCLLMGSYDDRARASLLTLTADGYARPAGAARVLLADGPSSASAHALGVGVRLFFFADSRCWCLDRW